MLASLFTQVIWKTHLCPAQAGGTAAFQACVACVVLDSGSDSKLFWFSSYELERGGITAREMANSPTPSVPAYTQRPVLSRWLLFADLPCLVLAKGGDAFVKR